MPQKETKPAAKKRDTEPADLTADLIKRRSTQFVVYEISAELVNAIVGGVAKRLETTYAVIARRVKDGILTEEEGERIKADVRGRYEDMAARARAEKEASGETSDEDNPELSDAAKEAVEARWSTFWQDATGIYLEARTIKAAIREAHSALGTFTAGRQMRKRGGHNDGTYVVGTESSEKVYLMRNGEALKEPDDFEDRVVLLKTAQGPRSALKRIDVVLGKEEGPDFGCNITFRIGLLRECSITENDLINALSLLEFKGLGAMASLGFGKFIITSFKRLGAMSMPLPMYGSISEAA